MREMESKPRPQTPENPDLQPAGDAAFEMLLEEVARTGRPDEEVSREALAHIVANRPFAPWEVQHRQNWRFPLVAASGLFGSAAVLGFAPLLRLEPSTAGSFWLDVVLAASIRPIETLWAARGLLGEAGQILRSGSTGTSLLLLALLGLTAAAAGAIGRSARRLQLSDGSR